MVNAQEKRANFSTRNGSRKCLHEANACKKARDKDTHNQRVEKNATVCREKVTEFHERVITIIDYGGPLLKRSAFESPKGERGLEKKNRAIGTKTRKKTAGRNLLEARCGGSRLDGKRG